MSENGQKSIFDKKFTQQTPIIFASFGGMVSIKIFSKTQNGPVMNKQKMPFEPLDKKFLK